MMQSPLLRRLFIGTMLAAIVGLPVVTICIVWSRWREHCIRQALLESREASLWWPPSWRRDHKAYRTLLHPVSVEFIDTPLSDVMDFMQESSGLPVVLDPVAVKEGAIHGDWPVTIHVEVISLGSALKLMLSELDATYTVKDGAVEITGQASGKHADWSLLEELRAKRTEETIRQKLQLQATLEFANTPLNDVIDFLRRELSVNIWLDRMSLEEVGITSDAPVTVHVEQVSFERALKLMLDELKATYLIEDEVLKIVGQSRGRVEFDAPGSSIQER